MSEPLRGPSAKDDDRHVRGGGRAVDSKPTDTQRRYLSRGLDQPGGKLPLFDEHGRAFDRKTIESCVEKGWAEPWFDNPTKPGWTICKLTVAGYAAIGRSPPT